MKIGDLVRVKSGMPMKSAGGVWHEFMGQSGVIIELTNRLHIPAFKVMIMNEIVEFDHDELEIVLE